MPKLVVRLPAVSKLACTCALATILASAELAQASTDRPEPAIRPALDGIFEAFDSHPLVGIGEAHQVAQILDFYRDIVQDPRFAQEVGNVVVEFGGAAYQDVIDRYVAGETVPYAELRKVWTETVGWVPAVPSEGYARFFGYVRQTNLMLPPEQRIRVWLGEPPIDWSEIDTTEEYRAIAATRDSHAAEVILKNILAENRKALVIYGGGHLERTNPWELEASALIAEADPGGPMSQGQNATLRDLVEAEYPGSFFVAMSYRGFRDEVCTRRFEERFAEWPMPALAVSVRGTTLEDAMRACLTPFDAGQMRFPPSIPENVQERVRAILSENVDRDRPLLADSVIFYAPAAELTVATQFIEFMLDEEWRAELDRRNRLITGRPLGPQLGNGFPASPVPYGGRD